MAVPRNRSSRSARGQRRSHHAKPKIFACICENCKNPRMPHRMCPSCNFYRGKQVLTTTQTTA